MGWFRHHAVFAFANAGMAMSLRDLGGPVTLAVFSGLVLGKLLGVLTFSCLAVRSRIARCPPDLSWRLLAGGGLLAGIGFTMALFIANLAFSESLFEEATLGIFAASVVSAAAGLVLLGRSPTRGISAARS